MATVSASVGVLDLSYFVDEKTLTRLAGAFGEEDAAKVISVLKGGSEITDDEIATKT